MRHTAAKIVLINSALIIALLATTELALRHQSIVELNYKNESLSEVIHHRRSGQREAEADSFQTGECKTGARPLTILFLGDSWIEGGEIVTVVGESLREETRLGQRCYELLNAGVTSYSPLLYTLKARLVSQVRPIDIIVVNVDETDLMDDWLRYRPAVVRDHEGELLRVPFSRDRPGYRDHQAYVEMTRHRWYLVRLIKKAIHISLSRPAYERRERIRKPTYENILAPQLSMAPHQTHDEEVDYFRDTVEEMIRTLVSSVREKSRVLITYHPHYLGMPTAAGSQRYNDVVPRVLREVSDIAGVTFYDARMDAAEAYVHQPEKFFQWPDDPFSHLTNQGYQVYGRLIARELSERILRLPAP